MFQDKGYHFINSHISVKKLIGLVKTQIFQDYSFFLQKYKYFDIPKSPYFHCEKLNDGRNRNEVLISKEFFFKIKENPIYMPEISFLEDVFIESERIFNKYIKLISNNSLLLILNYTTIVIKLIEYKFDNKLFFNHPHFDKTLFSVVWGSNILHENFLIAPYSLKFEDRLEIKDLNHVKEDSFPIIIPGVRLKDNLNLDIFPSPHAVLSSNNDTSRISMVSFLGLKKNHPFINKKVTSLIKGWNYYPTNLIY